MEVNVQTLIHDFVVAILELFRFLFFKLYFSSIYVDFKHQNFFWHRVQADIIFSHSTFMMRLFVMMFFILINMGVFFSFSLVFFIGNI